MIKFLVWQCTRIVYNKGLTTRIVYNKGLTTRIVYNKGLSKWVYFRLNKAIKFSVRHVFALSIKTRLYQFDNLAHSRDALLRLEKNSALSIW